jgi:hypothetical protein
MKGSKHVHHLTLSSLVPGGPATGPLSRARRLKATSIVGTFSGASTVDLEADRLRIFKTLSRTRNSFPNPDPMSLPEPSAAAPELLDEGGGGAAVRCS